MDEVKIKEIFDQCDTDKSGYIEHTEMNIKAVLIKSGFSEQKASLLSKASMRSLLVANPTRHPKTSLVVLGKANLGHRSPKFRQYCEVYFYRHRIRI